MVRNYHPSVIVKNLDRPNLTGYESLNCVKLDRTIQEQFSVKGQLNAGYYEQIKKLYNSNIQRSYTHDMPAMAGIDVA